MSEHSFEYVPDHDYQEFVDKAVTDTATLEKLSKRPGRPNRRSSWLLLAGAGLLLAGLGLGICIGRFLL